MKRCPECRRDYYDDTLLYCLDDGSALLEGPAPYGGLSASRAAAGTESPTMAYPNMTGKVAAPTGNSIAVLPFSNISADPENEYFCDGLAEELLNALAKLEGLKVAARTSAFLFRDENADIGEIGRKLGVSTILQGSVRKVGDQLRISVRLLNTEDGYHLWSETYNREMRNIFELQDEITAAVVEALKLKVFKGSSREGREHHDLEAYGLYLKGRYHISKLTPVDVQKSLTCFQEAIELDPSFALAHAGMAEVLLRMTIAGELPPEEFFPQARSAARRAVEIDPALPEGHVALAWIAFWYEWDWKSAEASCLRAIELNPNDVQGRLVLAHVLSNTGRHMEAVDEITRANHLDPLSLFGNAIRGQILFFAGTPDEALHTLVSAAELEPNFWLTHLFAANAYAYKGQFEQAADEARIAGEQWSGSTQPKAVEAYALAMSGKLDEAQKLVDEIKSLTSERYVPPYHIAQAVFALGNKEAALDWLDKGFESRDVKMVFLGVDPFWARLRVEPRFRRLLQRMGFEDPCPDNAGEKTAR